MARGMYLQRRVVFDEIGRRQHAYADKTAEQCIYKRSRVCQQSVEHACMVNDDSMGGTEEQ